MTKLLLACFEDNLGQLLVRPAPSGAPFIIDAVQAAKPPSGKSITLSSQADLVTIR